MAAAIQLREITPESLHAVLDLAIAPEQRQFVAKDARSIAEAHFEPRTWIRAVVDGEEVVMRLTSARRKDFAAPSWLVPPGRDSHFPAPVVRENGPGRSRTSAHGFEVRCSIR